MKLCDILSLIVVILPSASAHYFFPHLIHNGNFTNFYEYVREDTQGYMPYKGNYDSTDLRCNVGSQQFAQKTSVYKVKAGDEIGFGSDFNATILHPGPMQVYLSKAPGDVREYDGSGDWFKIYQLGPTGFGSDGIQWGVTGRGNFTFTLPKETPAGQYLLRIEHIRVHGAGDYGGAEFFFNCAQIEVESDSTAVPGPTVKIPGVYTGHEPGIEFYMYRPWLVNFVMPGPVLWPSPVDPNITALGVSIAPTATSWSLPAVTNSFTAATTSALSSFILSTITSSLSTSPSPSLVLPEATTFASFSTVTVSSSTVSSSIVSSLVPSSSYRPEGAGCVRNATVTQTVTMYN